MKNTKSILLSTVFVASLSFTLFAFKGSISIIEGQVSKSVHVDSVNFIPLFGELNPGSYERSELLSQKKVTVSAKVGDNIKANYLEVTKYAVLIISVNYPARMINVIGNNIESESVKSFIESANSGDKIIIANIVGHDAEGYEHDNIAQLIFEIK